MNNNEAMNFFKNLTALAKDNPNCVKMANNTDFTHIDAEFILKYADKQSEILDLGSGTGLIINRIYDKVKSVDCIEPFKEFSKYIAVSPNVNIINKSILDFETDKKYDLITAFGIIQYFNEEETINIYKKFFSNIKQNGKIIIKNQFGINNDVIVEGFSKEQKTNYYSSYRYINKEINILSNAGFKNIESIDIYPKEANRWDNTHFYAIVAEVN